jgi:hypothetical protein
MKSFEFWLLRDYHRKNPARHSKAPLWSTKRISGWSKGMIRIGTLAADVLIAVFFG